MNAEGMLSPQERCGNDGWRYDLAALAPALLHAVGLPLIVLGHSSSLVFANPLGRALTRSNGPLLRSGEAVLARQTDDQAELTAALKRSSQGLRSLVWLHGDERPYIGAVTPIECDGERLALFVFGPSPAAAHLSRHFLAHRQALTSTEAKVLELLCRGYTPRDIARVHGVALSTVRTQIATVRAKTSTGSIFNLLTLAMSLPPLGPHLA